MTRSHVASRTVWVRAFEDAFEQVLPLGGSIPVSSSTSRGYCCRTLIPADDTGGWVELSRTIIKVVEYGGQENRISPRTIAVILLPSPSSRLYPIEPHLATAFARNMRKGIRDSKKDRDAGCWSISALENPHLVLHDFLTLP